jgi:hypothetical protein
MLEELTPEQFMEWACYIAIEPTPAAQNTALICQTIHNEVERALVSMGKIKPGDAVLHRRSHYEFDGDPADVAGGGMMPPDEFAKQLMDRKVPHVRYR